MVEFRDGGTVYLKDIVRPTFIYNNVTGTRIKYGEYETIMEYFDIMFNKYKDAGFIQEAHELTVLEVKPDQELLDKLFQSTLYFNNYVLSIESKV